MTIGIDQLRHTIFLATGGVQDRSEIEQLANLLGVVEEVLPYLIFRRDGFSDCKSIRSAIDAAAAQVPAPALSRRRPGAAQALLMSQARAELAAAMTAVLQREMEEQSAQFRLDEALTAISTLSPEPSAEPSLRIR